jgi:hypothetical protein
VTRGLKALAAVAVVAALVVFAFQAVSPDDSSPAEPRSPQPRDGSADARRRAPEGMYVVSDVLADGQVKVQTWVRAPHPITRLRMTTTDPDLLPGSVESLDLVVRTMDGTLLAHRQHIGTNHQTIRLRAPAQELWFSYTVDGGLTTRPRLCPAASWPGCWGWTSTTRAPPAASYAGS